MQQENTNLTAAPYATTPKDTSYVSAYQSISALIAQVNILYIEIADSSDKKGRSVIGVCHMMKSWSLSL